MCVPVYLRQCNFFLMNEIDAYHIVPIPVAARCKIWICGYSPAGIVGSNAGVSWKSVCCECCVLSGRGLCVALITRAEESYRVSVVCLSVIVKSC